MSEKKVEITERYKVEIQGIVNKLSQIENGDFNELTKRRGSPYLNTIISQIREELGSLVHKVEYDKPSKQEELAEALSNIDRP